MPQYSLFISHSLMIYTCLANVCVAMATGLVMVLLFEAPSMHLEKLLLGSLGLARMPQIIKYKKEL